jgi:hypothetical protein
MASLTRNLTDGNVFLRGVRKQRERYREFVREQVEPAFRGEGQDRRPPREFVDSAFLFIRSDAADQGVRPRVTPWFWLSPDIKVSPLSSPGAYTETLTTGVTYDLACTVRNRGDLVVPSAKVEFWLTDPTIGFDTRFAKPLTRGRVPTAWVNPAAAETVHAPYTVVPDDAGHKCLIARTFSFSPADLPVHDTWLDPTMDRHVAQLNLNIVHQGQPFGFNWIHFPNTLERMRLVAATAEDTLRLAHPALADRTIGDVREGRTLLRRAELHLADAGSRVDTTLEGADLMLSGRGDGPSLDDQIRVRRLMEEVAAGAVPRDRARDIAREQRKQVHAVVRSRFEMRVPDLGLARGQAAALHLTATDSSDQVRGGVTLLVLG